jgi:hypothetical protein
LISITPSYFILNHIQHRHVHVLSHAVTLLSHHEVLAKISKWSVNSSQEEHLLLTYGVVGVVHVAEKTVGPAAQGHATNHAVDGDAPAGWLLRSQDEPSLSVN